MKLTGGLVFGKDHRMHEADLFFEDGYITEESTSGELDVSDCYVLPGLIDTHIHGAHGVGFYLSDGDLLPALDWLTSRGVTGILPTTCSETEEELCRDLNRLATYPDGRILGIHAEGPFINPKNRGGMRENRIQSPSCELLKKMQKAACGKIKILTLAPEMEGADGVIDLALALGIKVSMGHTSADFATASRAVGRGVTRLTHTYNGMRAFNHREVGVLGCGLDDGRVNCELICDLMHVSAPAVRLALRAKGADGITAISDASQFSGLPDGEYFQEDRTLYVKNGLCTLADGTISGSTRSLCDGAKNLFTLGVSAEDIAIMTSTNPARAAGVTDRGELIPGYRADVTVFDKDFNVKAVFLGGKRMV